METIVVSLVAFLIASITGLAGFIAVVLKQQDKKIDDILKEQRIICDEERKKDSEHYKRVIMLIEKDIAIKHEKEKELQELLACLTKSIEEVSKYIFENTKLKRVEVSK